MKYSGAFMNNTKWIKLFKVLSEHSHDIRKCMVVDIYDDIKRELIVPTIVEFDTTFIANGIKDIPFAGPILFKEIRWIEFPSVWSIARTMREQELEAQRYNQDLDMIGELLSGIGGLVMERDEEGLKIIGYR